ncbi:MAG: formate dehydrogenase accessory protein FdhE [Bacillota bacterium]
MERAAGPEKNLAQFYLALLDAEDKDGLLAAPAARPETFPSAAREKWQTGRPALTIIPLEIPAEELFQRLLAVVRACLQWQPGPQILPADLLPALQILPAAARKEFCAALAAGFPPDEKCRWAAKFGITPEMLDFLACHTLRPCLRRYGEALAGELNFDEWGRGSCPVCGGAPTMARISAGDGARKLYCSRCETEWRYKRIGCPYCGNEDAGSLSFLEVAGYEQYRLYLCEACRSYLKTVDERKTDGATDLFCADLVTARLDRLAADEGYRRAGTGAQS